MIRPEVQALLIRWAEPVFGMAVVAAGLWLVWLGGWLLVPLGLAVMVLGGALVLLAIRRMRFRQETGAPGLVEMDESQISYFGPAGGGFISLNDLAELRLLTRQGRRFWRLKQTDGQALLVPVDAVGAEQLFDAFSLLPGMDTQVLVAVLNPVRAPAGGLPAPMLDSLGPVIWQRDARRALT